MGSYYYSWRCDWDLDSNLGGSRMWAICYWGLVRAERRILWAKRVGGRGRCRREL